MATFIDTNILLYAISTAEEEAEKCAIARRILLRTDLAFSVQVFQEFYVQATRSGGARIAPEVAVRFITSWTRFPIQLLTIDLCLPHLQRIDALVSPIGTPQLSKPRGP